MATLVVQNVQEKRRVAFRSALSAAILTAFLIRMVVVCCAYHSLPDANKFYENFGWETGWVARALASGHGFTSAFFTTTQPTAMVSPIYTGLLAGVFRLFGIYTLTSAFVILSLNSLFSALTCIPVYFSAKYSLGARGAKLAAWAWAIYPLPIYFSAARVWEYALTSLLFTTCFCILQRIHTSSKWVHWLGFGLLYGITANVNPAVLSCLPFFLLFALWRVRKTGGRWLVCGVLTAVGVLIALAPWTVRNYHALHVFCPIRDNYWSNVYAGNIQDNTPNRYPFARDGEPASNPAAMSQYVTQGEISFFAERRKLAIDFIEHNPLPVATASLRRVVMYWTGYWSFSSSYRQSEPTELPLALMLAPITLLMLRGLFRLCRSNRVRCLPYLILVAVFPLTYYCTIALMDYREPIEPAVVVLVIAGLFPLANLRSPGNTGAPQEGA